MAMRRLIVTERQKKSAIHIATFARAPIEGQVKTRLIPAYGARKATAIYCFLAERTFAAVREACDAMNASATIWIADEAEIAHPTCVEWSQRFGFPLHAQIDGGLGERMFHGLATSFLTYEAVAILGTDCPVICGKNVINTICQLNTNMHWSAIPVEDGGYLLIATNQPSRTPFTGIAWSTSSVVESTRQRFREAGLAWAESPALWDVDEPADVERAIRDGLLPPDL
jgi:uncharacterized protein